MSEKSTSMSEAARSVLLAELLGDVSRVAEKVGAIEGQLNSLKMEHWSAQLARSVEQMQSTWPTLMSAQVRQEIVRDLAQALHQEAGRQVGRAVQLKSRQTLVLMLATAFLGGVVVSLVFEQVLRFIR